ncbi:hypothetical protein P171DRAFT_159844 [Karstenula rhodostoma CBS 690.94]|uniref:Uncharacterized protein n=1 Tax=Karstenula rhodostoma CBS 690.94 TaxID=1392251 RepID=A0A9P4U6U7_9PLEO|nr:hypothetical protein P171DRAFT_159844 [Karstenula rhodostoma CBS 690.94]
MGTISSFLNERPDLRPLLEALERFDARNLETTATLQPDGTFILHTPHPGAAKTMPPSSPHAGMARTAVVFARLRAAGRDHGVRPFIVPLNDASGAMSPGVSCTLFPARPGAKAIDHASTTFTHVPLPAGALLGSLTGTPADERWAFLHAIHRVTIGTLCLSTSNATVLRVSACIAGRYSARRHVGAPNAVPILSFSTQYGPIARMLAHAVVFDSWALEATRMFIANVGKLDMQNVLGGVFKATVLSYTQPALSDLVDRCGWQGLYAHNQIAELWLAEKGNSIAEGDFLVLCIRLASEVLLRRYTPPPPRDPASLLARHEAALWADARRIHASLHGGHRGADFNARILPLSLPLVQATGQRMAYEAAKDAMLHGNAARGLRVTPQVLELYEVTCVMGGLSWYVENGVVTRQEVFERDVEAVGGMVPVMEGMINDPAVDAFINAPMVGEEGLAAFFRSLPSFQGPGTSARAKL